MQEKLIALARQGRKTILVPPLLSPLIPRNRHRSKATDKMANETRPHSSSPCPIIDQNLSLFARYRADRRSPIANLSSPGIPPGSRHFSFRSTLPPPSLSNVFSFFRTGIAENAIVTRIFEPMASSWHNRLLAGARRTRQRVSAFLEEGKKSDWQTRRPLPRVHVTLD